MGVEPERVEKPLLHAARTAFFLMLCLLPWMKHGMTIRGLEAFPADLLFLVATTLWLAALAAGQTRLRLHPAFLTLALYFAAMADSAVFSVEPRTSAFKLFTQLYPLLLPVLAFNLVRNEADLHRAFIWWLAPAMALAVSGVATILLFPFFGYDSFLSGPLHHFGTLPPGPYPRIELTFEYPAMLANYLGVSLMLLILARRLRWLGARAAAAAGAAVVLSALFALTPGFGGILAMLALWIWYRLRGPRPALARLAFAATCLSAVLEVLVAAVTPILHPTAPFLIHVPGLPVPLAPAVRLLAWIAAAHNFLASPIWGHGIGVDAVSVLYQAPEDSAPGYVTDAHNFVLNIAAQCGIVGVLSVAAIVGFVARQAWRSGHKSNPLLFGLSIAWLSGFAIEGLVGSFEDARHLWILLGLLFSVACFEASPADTTFGHDPR
jgi:O-antigen ligase